MKNLDLEEFIRHNLKHFQGKTINELAHFLSGSFKPSAKSYPATVAQSLIQHILSLEPSRTNEFIAAGIKIKSIRLEYDGTIKENMSFPAFKYLEIINESWESSTLRTMFLTHRFLFVVFKYDSSNQLKLHSSQFWSIPKNDLEGEVQRVWQETVRLITSGYSHDLPKASDSHICHVRPHARDSSDTYETPQGTYEVKKSFWLNKEYIEDIIL